jgi:hypothetical protein
MWAVGWFLAVKQAMLLGEAATVMALPKRSWCMIMWTQSFREIWRSCLVYLLFVDLCGAISASQMIQLVVWTPSIFTFKSLH